MERNTLRIMGLDYGSKTVGVAISDERAVVALPIETIKRERENKLRQTFARIEKLVMEYNVGVFLVGYPKNMNESIGERANKTDCFVKELTRRTGMEVVLWDERLTTHSANKVLMEAGIRRENRKNYLDKMAATIILQGYLDYKNKENVNGGKQGEDCNNE